MAVNINGVRQRLPVGYTLRDEARTAMASEVLGQIEAALGDAADPRDLVLLLAWKQPETVLPIIRARIGGLHADPLTAVPALMQVRDALAHRGEAGRDAWEAEIATWFVERLAEARVEAGLEGVMALVDALGQVKLQAEGPATVVIEALTACFPPPQTLDEFDMLHDVLARALSVATADLSATITEELAADYLTSFGNVAAIGRLRGRNQVERALQTLHQQLQQLQQLAGVGSLLGPDPEGDCRSALRRARRNDVRAAVDRWFQSWQALEQAVPELDRLVTGTLLEQVRRAVGRWREFLSQPTYPVKDRRAVRAGNNRPAVRTTRKKGKCQR
jgi:hypothetical protein